MILFTLVYPEGAMIHNMNVVNPVEVRMTESAKGSIYESIVAIGLRARQVNDQIKQQLQGRMANVITDSDETEGTNYDQLAISREFDVIPKPTFIAMREMLDGKVNYELPEIIVEEED